MPKLVFGVVDVAYTQRETVNGKTTAKRTTTGDVAEILESRYQVMRTFYETRKQKIADALAESMAKTLQDLFAGHPAQGSLTFDADQKIESDFRAFIFSNEMSTIAQSVFNPVTHEIVGSTGRALSGAAQRGVNHRKLHPYAKKNRTRPAFVDTGLYVRSFRAWTEK